MLPSPRNARPNKFLWVVRLSIVWKIAALGVLFGVLVATGVL